MKRSGKSALGLLVAAVVVPSLARAPWTLADVMACPQKRVRLKMEKPRHFHAGSRGVRAKLLRCAGQEESRYGGAC
jgi:hypothetical protein